MNRSRWSIILYDARNYSYTTNSVKVKFSAKVRKRIRTRPSEASSNFTGQSRTDAKKQNEAGSLGEAVGYHVKSSTGAG